MTRSTSSAERSARRDDPDRDEVLAELRSVAAGDRSPAQRAFEEALTCEPQQSAYRALLRGSLAGSRSIGHFDIGRLQTLPAPPGWLPLVG